MKKSDYQLIKALADKFEFLIFEGALDVHELITDIACSNIAPGTRIYSIDKMKVASYSSNYGWIICAKSEAQIPEISTRLSSEQIKNALELSEMLGLVDRSHR